MKAIRTSAKEDALSFGIARIQLSPSLVLTSVTVSPWTPTSANASRTSSNLKGLMILVDGRHEPTKDDIAMYQYAQYLDLPILVVATKIDKIKKSQMNKAISVIKKSLDLRDKDQLLTFSSIQKFHLAELQSWVEDRLED